MNALEIFFAEWWPLCVGIGVVTVGVWFVGRSASHGYFLFTSPNSFGELARYSENEQKRLLQEASKETFRSWRSVLPPITFALVLSAGIALGRTIPKVTALPDTWWIHVIVAGLFGGAAAWFVKQFSVSCVRPFLRRLIEKTSHVAYVMKTNLLLITVCGFVLVGCSQRKNQREVLTQLEAIRSELASKRAETVRWAFCK